MRPERAPEFVARRMAADERAEQVRRKSLMQSLVALCGCQLAGAGMAATGLHVQSEDLGWALVYLGMFVGDAGAFFSVWWLYFRRAHRGDW